MAMYYVPRTYGGVGVMPGSLPGPTMDSIIVKFVKGPLRDRINDLSSRLAAGGAKRLFRGAEIKIESIPKLDEGAKQAYKWLNHDRVVESRKALTRLVQLRLAKSDESLRYENSQRLAISKGLDDLGKKPEFVKSDAGKFVIALSAKVPVVDLIERSEFNWLKEFEISFGDVVTFNPSCCDHLGPMCMIVGLDTKMAELGAQIGFGSREGTFREELFRIFQPVLRDPYFPKFDVPMLAAKLSKIP